MREVYDEAKKAGLNTKALRKIVAKRRAKAPDPQVEAAMHAYELALDEAATMVSNGDVSLREATAKTGFSKSAIQRQVSHRKRNASSGTEPEAPAASEERAQSEPPPHVEGGVGAGTLEARQGEDAAGRDAIPGLGVADRSATSPGGSETRQPALGDSAVVPLGCDTHPQPSVCSTEPEGMKCDGVLSGRVSGSDEQEASAAYRAGVEAASTPSAAAALTLYQRITGSFLPAPSDDPGPMPPFLRRARA